MDEHDLAGQHGKGHPVPDRGARGAPVGHPGRGAGARRNRGAEFEVELPDLLPPVPDSADEAVQEVPGAPVPASGMPGYLQPVMEPHSWQGGPAGGVSAPGEPVYHPPLGGVSAVPAGEDSAAGWGVSPSRSETPGHVPHPSIAAGVEEAGDLSGRGVSAAGAFGMAMLANLILAGFVASVIWAFPRETGQALRRVASRLDLGASRMDLVPESGVDRLAILRLEDRALYRGERSALEQLQRLSREIDSTDRNFEAVQASIIRVRQSYQMNLGEVPGPLDAREILPSIETEKDLPATAIVDVLRNRQQSPAKRQRAAYLLANERQDAAALSALFHTIQDDPSLPVVRQAFQSFQGLTGYPGRDFFDADAVDRWWARNSASFIGGHAKK